MKLHIFSDLHVGFGRTGWVPQLAPGADAVVCAGDVCEGLPEAFAYLREHIPAPTPIITVAGNHSFYRRHRESEMARGREAAEALGITFLENEGAVVGGVRFLGATLWTDYRLYGEREREAAMCAAAAQMNDHRLIRCGLPGTRLFEPADAADLHRASLQFLHRELERDHDGPTVVLTHHAPSAQAIAPRYRGDRLNPAFASDLDWLITVPGADAWVFGHTHTSFDFRIGRTRMLCNPHGYGDENVAGFNPDLVVELLKRQPYPAPL